MPDPDLLIRTAGEMRVSNYLLWQISYAELFVSAVLWPDFGVEESARGDPGVRGAEPAVRGAGSHEHVDVTGSRVAWANSFARGL